MKQLPKCIIFDCDGVLVDSEPITCQIITEMAWEIGIDVDYHFIEKNFVGNSWKKNKEILEKKGNKPLPANFFQAYRKRSFQAFKKKLKPIKGVPELIHQLNIPFGVASSGPIDKIRLNLGIVGLLPKFEGNIFSCWEIGKWKPDPAIFLYAAASMGFSPADCIVVEDSLFGIQAAIAGGFRVVAYANTHNEADLKATGVEVITKMKALYPMINVYENHQE